MRLFINDLEARLTPGTSINFNFRFLDTQEPSAIKTGYSKTITLPACKENSEIFGEFKVKYPFTLLADDGRILEKGYLTLDNFTENNQVKSFQVTLYGTLGDFFYNLQGESDNPKTLADLYWGHVTGLTPTQENIQTLLTWNINYVYTSWFHDEAYPWSAFRGVPCIWDDNVFDNSKTVVYTYNGALFPPTSSDGTGSAWEGQDGSTAVLVTADENTCYAKQDFRVDRMPLGIRYQDIIKACCASESNGGYKVTLDPDFFNSNNPYWENLFLLKKLPGMDYNYSVTKNSISNFTASRVSNAGNYPGSVKVLDSCSVALGSNSTPWIKSGDNLILDSNYTISENRVSFEILPFIHTANGGGVVARTPDRWIDLDRVLELTVEAINNTTGETVSTSKKYGPGDRFNMYVEGDNWNPTVFVPEEPYKDYLNIPSSWTNIRFKIKTSTTSTGDMTITFSRGRPKYRMTAAGFCAPGDNAPVPKGYFTLETYTLQNGGQAFTDPSYTKKELLGASKTPFEYLTTFTKMFNLRFYVKPGSKEVEILTLPSFLSKVGPLDISDRVCYDRDYIKSRKILDEEFLEFDMEPNSNETTDNYVSEVDKNLFDRKVQVSVMEGLGGTKTYFRSNLKVGSKARNTSALARRTKGSYCYYGFNQSTPYEVTYVSGSVPGDNFVSEDQNYNYIPGSQQYDFLTLGDGIDDTIVMYSGLRKVPWDNSPAFLTKTSVEMVRYAGKPCWLGGLPILGEGTGDYVLGAPYKSTYYIPHYGLVPSVSGYGDGLTYTNVNYESLIVTSNIYDRFFADFLDRIYGSPLQVECWVRLATPELRRLYWFDNAYWILTEISDYNYESDSPCKCKFVRYKYNA